MKRRTIEHSGYTLLKSDGGIPLRILLILITLSLVGGSLFFMLENQKKINKINHRKAVELSDYGFQELGKKAFDNATGVDPEKIEGIARTEYDGGWFAVSVSTTRKNDVLSVEIKSEGRYDTQSAVQKKTITFRRETLDSGDSAWVPLSR